MSKQVEQLKTLCPGFCFLYQPPAVQSRDHRTIYSSFVLQQQERSPKTKEEESEEANEDWQPKMCVNRSDDDSKSFQKPVLERLERARRTRENTIANFMEIST